jgi:hypothetical protein
MTKTIYNLPEGIAKPDVKTDNLPKNATLTVTAVYGKILGVDGWQYSFAVSAPNATEEQSYTNITTETIQTHLGA